VIATLITIVVIQLLVIRDRRRKTADAANIEPELRSDEEYGVVEESDFDNKLPRVLARGSTETTD